MVEDGGARAVESTNAVGVRDTCFVLEGDWPGSGYWAYVIRNFLLAFEAADPCRLWIRIDRQALSIGDALRLLGPLTASFGDAPFAEIVLEDDPVAHPTGRKVIQLPTGNEMASWTVDRFRCAAMEGSAER